MYNPHRGHVWPFYAIPLKFHSLGSGTVNKFVNSKEMELEYGVLGLHLPLSDPRQD